MKRIVFCLQIALLMQQSIAAPSTCVKAKRCGSVNFFDWNCSDINSTTPLMRAIKANNLREVKRILLKIDPTDERNPNLNICDNQGNTAIHYAAKGRDPEILQAIWNADQNAINSTNDKGETPMVLAAKQSELAIIEALLDNGAELEYTTPTGSTASVFDVVNPKTGDTILHTAIKADNIILFNKLLKIADDNLKSDDFKKTLNRTNHSGDALIHTAIKANNQNGNNMARILALEGAATALENQYGDTALKLAEKTNRKELAQQLLEYNGLSISGIQKTLKAHPTFRALFTETGAENIPVVIEKIEKLIETLKEKAPEFVDKIKNDKKPKSKTRTRARTNNY